MTTLIIPIYNGEAAIPAMWKVLRDWKQAGAGNTALAFVNDGSTDNTGPMLDVLVQEDPSIMVHHLRVNMGKGHAIRTAIEKMPLQGAYVAFTDVDLPYGLGVIHEATAYLEKHKNTDIVIGSRKKAHKKQYSHDRKVWSRVFRLFVPAKVRKFSDTQCGLKVFRMPVAKDVFAHAQTSRWVFDVELLLRAVQTGYNVHEISVTLQKGLARGKGGVSALHDGVRILFDLWRIHIALWQGKYANK